MRSRRAAGERLGGNLTPFGRQNGISPAGCAPAAREGGEKETVCKYARRERQKIKEPWCLPSPGAAGRSGALWVAGCSLLYEMFGSAGAICILSLAPVSSKEGESSLRDQLPFKINY